MKFGVLGGRSARDLEHIHTLRTAARSWSLCARVAICIMCDKKADAEVIDLTLDSGSSDDEKDPVRRSAVVISSDDDDSSLWVNFV